MIIDKLLIRKLIFLATLLMGIGIFLIIRSYDINPVNIIDKAIARKQVNIPFDRQKNAIYLIKFVNVNCHPCMRYAEFKKNPKVKITFYLDRSFTGNDIANFKETFEINEQAKIEYIPNGWQYIYKEYFKKEEITPINLLILVNEKNKVKKVLKF